MKAALLILLLLTLNGSGYSSKDCPLYEGFMDSFCIVGDKLNSYLRDSPTAWIVEFYSSWCGHCQHFSPTWKKIATRLKKWSKVVHVGQIDCSSSKNRATCDSHNIQGYPTFKFFKPHEQDKNVQTIVGTRPMNTMIEKIITHLSSQVPSFAPLTTTDIEKIDILVFEDKSSIVGKEIILDFYSSDISIRRIHQDNVELIRQFSILELPSIVIRYDAATLNYNVISSSAKDDKVVEDFEAAITNSLPQLKTKKKVSKTQNAPEIKKSNATLLSLTTSMTRTTMTDLLSTISYALRYEVGLHHLIYGETFFALHQFVYSLEKAFASINKSVSSNLNEIRAKLDSRLASALITGTEWKITLRRKLSNDLFPLNPVWIKCAGTQPHYRGYPCGLWTLMHSATVLSLNSDNPDTSSREALYSSARFVLNFFSCIDCRRHFSKLFESLQRSPLSYDGDSILWLWEAHNIVSRRLRNETTTDPTHPKNPFPSHKPCPYCYVKIDGSAGAPPPSWDNVGLLDGFLTAPLPGSTYLWNTTAVFLYLCNFYGYNLYDRTTHEQLMRLGWPRLYPASSAQDFANRRKLSHLKSNQSQLKFSYSFVLVMTMLSLFVVFSLLFKQRRSKRTMDRFKLS